MYQNPDRPEVPKISELVLETSVFKHIFLQQLPASSLPSSSNRQLSTYREEYPTRKTGNFIPCVATLTVQKWQIVILSRLSNSCFSKTNSWIFSCKVSIEKNLLDKECSIKKSLILLLVSESSQFKTAKKGF